MDARSLNASYQHGPDGLITFLLIAIAIVAGCSRPSSVDRISTDGNASDSFSEQKGRQYDSISEFELTQLVRTSAEPILVEFGVDFNCARCEQMTPVVNELGQQFEGQARIVRASFNTSSAVQAQLGLRLCPSYLFYHNGKLVDRCDGPTMLPMLKSKLSRLISQDRNPGVTSAPRTYPGEVSP
ncbi:MAG: thioredoxin family protein [Planctomycetaceae bacterium]|nr:thioredoxin family protein [Planctomycetaceae bacterium]